MFPVMCPTVDPQICKRESDGYLAIIHLNYSGI